MRASVYVHFPYCLEKCPYCDFVSYKTERKAIDHDAYADAVIRELSSRDFAGRTIASVFFGGGHGFVVTYLAAMVPAFLLLIGFAVWARRRESRLLTRSLTDCASRKMMTYALARDLTTSDDPYLNQVRSHWATQGYGLKDLMKDIVTNDTFKFRRGEAP